MAVLPDINKALLTFISTELEVQAWEGEVQRFDLQGNPIYPNAVASPSVWPIVQVTMPEDAMDIEWTFEDPHTHKGPIYIKVYGTTGVQVRTLVDSIFTLLASATNWRLMDQYLGGPDENPCYFISLLCKKWFVKQDENVRLAEGLLCFRGGLTYEAMIHGAVPTS